jgi:uncharacterized protein (TIGR03435 family)
MSRAAIALLLAFFSITGLGQDLTGGLAFEVADLKVNKSGEARMKVDFLPGGRLSMYNVPLHVMIVMAYHVRPDALTGGPAWMDSDRFDVVAKASQTASQNDLRLMLRALLAERFKLVVHTDQRVIPAYALALGKSGPKLQPEAPLLTELLSEQRCGPVENVAGQKHVVCQHVTLPVLADTLQEAAPRDIAMPVVDLTSLPGAYTFRLDWTPTARDSAGASPDAPIGPTLFEALESQLGLKLEQRKLPVPVIVIDHAERAPVEN